MGEADVAAWVEATAWKRGPEKKRGPNSCLLRVCDEICCSYYTFSITFASRLVPSKVQALIMMWTHFSRWDILIISSGFSSTLLSNP